MISPNITDYGKQIKMRLIENGMSQNELIKAVTTDTGLYFDSSYLTKVLNGKNSNPKIRESINKILQLEDSTEIVQ